MHGTREYPNKHAVLEPDGFPKINDASKVTSSQNTQKLSRVSSPFELPKSDATNSENTQPSPGFIGAYPANDTGNESSLSLSRSESAQSSNIEGRIRDAFSNLPPHVDGDTIDAAFVMVGMLDIIEAEQSAPLPELVPMPPELTEPAVITIPDNHSGEVSLQPISWAHCTAVDPFAEVAHPPGETTPRINRREETPTTLNTYPLAPGTSSGRRPVSWLKGLAVRAIKTLMETPLHPASLKYALPRQPRLVEVFPKEQPHGCTNRKHGVPRPMIHTIDRLMREGRDANALCFCPIDVSGKTPYGRHRTNPDGTITILTNDGHAIHVIAPLVQSAIYSVPLFFDWNLFATRVDARVVRVNDELVWLSVRSKRRWYCQRPRATIMWKPIPQGQMAVRKEANGETITVSVGRVGADTSTRLDSTQYDIVMETLAKSGAKATCYTAGTVLTQLGEFKRMDKTIAQNILAAIEHEKRTQSIPLQSGFRIKYLHVPPAETPAYLARKNAPALPPPPKEKDKDATGTAISTQVHTCCPAKDDTPTVTDATLPVTPPVSSINNDPPPSAHTIPDDLFATPPATPTKTRSRSPSPSKTRTRTPSPLNYARNFVTVSRNGIDELVPPQYEHRLFDERDEPDQERKPTGRQIGPHFVHYPAEMPVSSRANDMASIHYRLDTQRSPLRKIPQRYFDYAREFNSQINTAVGKLTPWKLELVDEHQSTPIQRARNAFQIQKMDSETCTIKISAFGKGEGTGNRAAMRNIASVFGDTNLQLLRYVIPLQKALKTKLKWYCSGLIPSPVDEAPGMSVEERLHQYCSKRFVVYATDESKMDAHATGSLDRIILGPVLHNAFEVDFTDVLLLKERTAEARTKTGDVYLAEGTITGSANTSVRNTLLKAWKGYCANRERGDKPAKAFNSIGLCSGDDGVSGCEEKYEKQVSYDLGFDTKIKACSAGSIVTLLSRCWRDIWSGDLGSVQDPLRLMAKLSYSVAPPDMDAQQLIIDKVSAYCQLDPNVSVYQHFLRALVRITGKQPSKWEEIADSWQTLGLPYWTQFGTNWTQLGDADEFWAELTGTDPGAFCDWADSLETWDDWIHGFPPVIENETSEKVPGSYDPFDPTAVPYDRLDVPPPDFATIGKGTEEARKKRKAELELFDRHIVIELKEAEKRNRLRKSAKAKKDPGSKNIKPKADPKQKTARVTSPATSSNNKTA